jgi:dephospho-CoA kinase
MKKLKIGITGGIGSGKTTVCKIFETLGIPVYYADDRAKALYVEDLNLKKKVIQLLGEKAYFENGELNRQYVSDLVFKDVQLLQKLNALIHPAVQNDGDTWHEKQKDASYTLKEAALLYESGGYKYLDKMITVYAPVSLRIERVILRGDGTLTKEDVEARIAKQMDDEEKMKRADFVIINDGKQALMPQVIKIHQQILKMK